MKQNTYPSTPSKLSRWTLSTTLWGVRTWPFAIENFCPYPLNPHFPVAVLISPKWTVSITGPFYCWFVSVLHSYEVFATRLLSTNGFETNIQSIHFSIDPKRHLYLMMALIMKYFKDNSKVKIKEPSKESYVWFIKRI